MNTGDRPVWYTFGNHFHWVDMQWKWGYDVLARSVRDMLAFCAATGSRGNVNFDGVGYEKMAAESPEALRELRAAVGDGRVEVVGASYGQPYALFHGGESAVRQLTYGVRSATRLLGVRPRSFWEEEFYFFPQLPQLLRGAGFEYAALFFQWTWHTPHVPYETAPAIWWEGLDGSRVLTAPRSSLNLHQWPEDFAALRADPLLAGSPAPVILQWLELLPSEDWMCRSELLLPGMAELLGTPGIAPRFGTLSEVLDAVREHAVPRRYTMDDVFHGMSLGKNGNLLHRRSRRTEETLLAAETLSVVAGWHGRPYPNWDVYPTWELEEVWRDLLAFQHHDNDECEGLCGSIGYASVDRGQALAAGVLDRTVRALSRRIRGGERFPVAFNPLGWARPAFVDTGTGPVLVDLPPAGWAVVTDDRRRPPRPAIARTEPGTVTLTRGDLRLVVDTATGLAREVAAGGRTIWFGPAGLGNLSLTRDGQPETFKDLRVDVVGYPTGDAVVVRRRDGEGHEVTVTYACAPERDAIDLTVHSERLPRPDPRYAASLVTLVEPDLDDPVLWHDTPYAVTLVEGRGVYQRKYPTGDWMTSAQVFEDVVDPFTALRLLDLRVPGGDGLLWLHDGTQGYLRADRGFRAVLSMNDPWDEDHYVDSLTARFRLMPHGPDLTPPAMWRLAAEFTGPALIVPPGPAVSDPAGPGARDLPDAWSLLGVDADSVAVTAVYRETDFSAVASERHATAETAHPILVRLVELAGTATTAGLSLAGTVRRAWRTDLLGGLAEELLVDGDADAADEAGRSGTGTSRVRVPLAPYQITTVALDVVEARKVSRDLDARREVWATVHRVDADGVGGPESQVVADDLAAATAADPPG